MPFFTNKFIFNNTVSDNFILKSSIPQLIFLFMSQLGKICKTTVGTFMFKINTATSLSQAAAPITSPSSWNTGSHFPAAFPKFIINLFPVCQSDRQKNCHLLLFSLWWIAHFFCLFVCFYLFFNLAVFFPLICSTLFNPGINSLLTYFSVTFYQLFVRLLSSR